MTLIPARDLFYAARAQGYALGYFESWNLESLQGVLDAAEATHSPVIIGFNGEFLTHPERMAQERLQLYGALGRAAAESASVPCGLMFNECASDDFLQKAVTEGFNLVMLADPAAPYDEYERRVRNLVGIAHEKGAAVEAEIGELPTGSSGNLYTERSSLTDPDLAARFIKATGVDLLSVSVGNVHIMVNGTHALDMDHLAAIRQRIDLPLGLHGGSGISPDSLRTAIQMGVVKVAYGTCLKQRYLAAVSQALNNPQINPHMLLGMGGPEDVMLCGRRAVRDAVLERTEILGCCGRA
jgi:ketose-bisphosphate aldolase